MQNNIAANSMPIEDEEEVIGVKVLHNAPHPLHANKNLGKWPTRILL